MDWDKLRIFYAVADAGSFTAAGEALHLSQPAVSRQISALEEGLGVKLFHRHARGLLLTEQGEILKKTAQDISSKLSLIEEELADTRERPKGPLVITVSDFIGSTWLVPKLKEFRVQHPDIQLTIIFEDRILNLGMREADAAIRLHPPKEADLIQRHLKNIHFHICASKDYLLQNGKPETVEDLKNHCLIAFPENANAPFYEPNWLFKIADVSFEKNYNLLMMNSMYAIYQAILSGAGIAILPDYLVKARDDIEIVLPDLKRPSVDMFFVYAEERRNSKRIAIFRDFLLKNLSETNF